MAAIVVVTLAVGSVGSSEPPTNADRVLVLTRSIRCPQCAGQSVAESDVSVSREIRRDIAQRVEQGQTDDEIRAYYASDTVYGPDALLAPPTEGVGGLVWLLPVAALALAAVGLGLAFRRWSASGRRDATEDDRALVAEALRADESSSAEGENRSDREH